MTMVGHGGSSWRRDGEIKRKKILEKMRKNGCVQQQPLVGGFAGLRRKRLYIWVCFPKRKSLKISFSDQNLLLSFIFLKL